MEKPLAPPFRDWQSPEVGDAIRVILDAWEAGGMPQDEVQRRFRRLSEVMLGPPEVLSSAYMAIINSALALPALLPTDGGQIPEVRRQIEKHVYDAINEMPPWEPPEADQAT